jgi:hypothetical protein
MHVVSKRPAASDAPGVIATLSPLLKRDIEGIACWYDNAIVLAGSLAPLSELSDSTGRRRTLVLTDGTNQEPVGLMLIALDDPEPGWATVNQLAIARQEERDMAALGIALLETGLGQEATRIRAAVPADVGLALYFWLRLGYRPIAAGGRLWMMRDLDA